MCLKAIFTTLLFLLGCLVSFGQTCPPPIPLSVTATATESTCESNGTITVVPADGEPFPNAGNPVYSNEIIAGPMTATAQSSNTFSALLPGTYTVQTTDACGGTATVMATVVGSYTTLGLTFNSTGSTCGGGGGGIICGIPSAGLPPYSYELFDDSGAAPVSIATSSDSCFTNLTEGDYLIRVYDACGNFQTRNVTLDVLQYWALPFLHTNQSADCVEICKRLSPRSTNTVNTTAYPLSWTIPTSDVPSLLGLSGTFTANNQSESLCYPTSHLGSGESYTIVATDACGVVTSATITVDGNYTLGLSTSTSCSGAAISVGEPRLFCDPGTTTYEMTSAPAGFTLPPAQTVQLFDNLISGEYCFEVTDCCGDVYTNCITTVASDWNVRITGSQAYGCAVGEVGFIVSPAANPFSNNAVFPVVSTIISAPAAYPVTLPQVFTGNISGPPGEYCISITDDCGVTNTACKTLATPIAAAVVYTVTPGCIGDNTLTATFTGNVGFRSRLSLIGGGNIGFESTGSVRTWTNLVGGYYEVNVRARPNGCIIRTDTVHVPEYVNPNLSAAWGINCDNNQGLITASGADGVPPYSYEIVSGPSTFPSQTSPQFAGLANGTYEVRIVDDCLNSTTTFVSIEPFAPIISGVVNGAACPGEPVSIFVDSVAGATYSWTGPNGFISSSSSINWASFNAMDAGMYTVDITVANPDNSVCVNDQVSITLQAICLVECPTAFNEIDNAAALCDGSLGTEFTDWQALVEADTDNMAAIADANTAAAVNYVGTANGVHTGADVCVAEMQTVLAELQCFGPNGMDEAGAGDDFNILLGTFDLTVNPNPVLPVDAITDCVNTPVAGCSDVFGTPTNPLNGAAVANWDGTSYTTPLGAPPGSLEIPITNSFGCSATMTLMTPACLPPPCNSNAGVIAPE